MYYVIVPLQNPSSGPARRAQMEGGTIMLDRKEQVNVYYTNENAVMQEASDLASKNPTRDYAIMSVLRIISTAKPKIITKIIDDQGQIVVEKPNG